MNVSKHVALVAALCLMGLLMPQEASGQETWRVTLIRATAGGETLCSNVSWTVTLAVGRPATQSNVCLRNVNATLTLRSQSVVLELSGNNIGFIDCIWDITDTIRGSGFISGNAVPATSLSGTARTNRPAPACRTTNQVTGSFQAQRIGGAPVPAPAPAPAPAPQPAPAPINPTVQAFVGTVTVARPGQLPVGVRANMTLDSGDFIVTGAAASITLRFPDGDLALGENTGFVVHSRRFFLLTPSFAPVQNSFARITWRCIPGVDPCASIATPNTGLIFNPPARPGFGFIEDRSTFQPLAAGDTTFTLSYLQSGGLGTSVITVETGAVAIQDLRGSSEVLSAGQSRRVVSAVPAVAAPLDLDADAVADVFTYDALQGSWTMSFGDGLPAATGRWPIAWQNPRPDLGVVQGEWTIHPLDFDGNGLTDFVLHHAQAGAAFLAVHDGRGGFEYIGLNNPTDPRVAPVSVTGSRLYVVNLNGDRFSDLLWYSPRSGTVTSWISWGTTAPLRNSSIGSPRSIPFEAAGRMDWVPASLLYPMALNGDDVVDILRLDPATGEWSWAINDGGGRFSITASGHWPEVTDAVPADFNGDRRPDVLVYDSRTGAWSQAMNTGSTFSARPGGTWAPALDIVAGDLDADGDADILLYSEGSGSWSTATSEGTGDNGGRLAAAASGTWRPSWEISPADFNADGRLDFFMYYQQAGTWMKALSDGRGGFVYEEGSWAPGLSAVVARGLTQGPVPKGALREPCTSEKTLLSRQTVHNLPARVSEPFVIFVNTTSDMRNVEPVSRSIPGSRGSGFRVPPGEQSFTSVSDGLEYWVVTNSAGTCVGIYGSGSGPYGIAAPVTTAILP